MGTNRAVPHPKDAPGSLGPSGRIQLSGNFTYEIKHRLEDPKSSQEPIASCRAGFWGKTLGKQGGISCFRRP